MPAPVVHCQPLSTIPDTARPAPASWQCQDSRPPLPLPVLWPHPYPVVPLGELTPRARRGSFNTIAFFPPAAVWSPRSLPPCCVYSPALLWSHCSPRRARRRSDPLQPRHPADPVGKLFPVPRPRSETEPQAGLRWTTAPSSSRKRYSSLASRVRARSSSGSSRRTVPSTCRQRRATARSSPNRSN